MSLFKREAHIKVFLIDSRKGKTKIIEFKRVLDTKRFIQYYNIDNWLEVKVEVEI